MTTDLITPDFNTPVVVEERALQALARLHAEIEAIAETDLAQINIDVPLAVSRALGVAPACTALRDRMARECAGVDLHAIDQIEDRAYAASAANTAYEAAVNPPGGFAAVAQETFDARTALLSMIKMLITCNEIKSERMADFNGGHGYRDAANDLQLCVHVLRTEWSHVAGKIPATEAQLSRAQGIAEKLQALVGVREQTPTKAADAALLRARTFTLLDRAYEEVRRAITFLRWTQGDADAIAPPLRTHDGYRKPADKNDDTVPAKKNDAVPADKKVDVAQPQIANIVPELPSTPAPSGLPRSNPYGKV